MKTLPVDIEKFGFVEREKVGSKTLTNRCGRDFLYYTLHYYFPDKFNPQGLNPHEIEAQKLFGFRLPSWLMWIQLQFFNLAKYLKSNNVKLFINEKEIGSFLNFFSANLFSRITYERAIEKIEQSINNGTATGIDIGLRYGGLLDHVIFVYGYDDDFLYVFDTHQVGILEYSKLTDDNRYFMKLPKTVVKERWNRFARVWEIKKNIEYKIYFITGVCGSGKTTALLLLKSLLPKDKYDLHDLDERGVPKGGGRAWRFEETKYLISLGKQNTEKGITTVISGFSRPSETKDLAPEQKNISFILLDADSNTIEQRILGRYPTEESRAKFTEKQGKSIEQFIQENTSFTETMRREAHEYGSYIIDTNNKTPEMIAGEIFNIVNNRV